MMSFRVERSRMGGGFVVVERCGSLPTIDYERGWEYNSADDAARALPLVVAGNHNPTRQELRDAGVMSTYFKPL